MKKLLSIVLVCAMICGIFVMPISVSAETDNRVWFDLNGNSEFFIPHSTAADSAYKTRTSRTDYVPGVDFGATINAPTGDFAIDLASITTNVGCLPYTTNVNNEDPGQYTFTDFAKDENDDYWWVINDVAYKMNVNAKVIKVYPGVDTTAISESEELTDDKKAELLAKYDTLEGVTIDVEDAQYSKVGFLTGISYSTKQENTAQLNVTLVYKDGEEITTPLTIKVPIGSTLNSYKEGKTYTYKMNVLSDSSARGSGGKIFSPYEVETLPSKVLDKIIVAPVSNSTTRKYKNAIQTISAWGVPVEEAAGETFEVTEAKYKDGKVTVKYTTTEDKEVKIIVAEYNDEDEESFAGVHILDTTLRKGETEYTTESVLASATKVKVFVWKDLEHFVPYYK